MIGDKPSIDRQPLSGSHKRTVTLLLLCLTLTGLSCSSLRQSKTPEYSTLPADQLLEFEEARQLNAKGRKAFTKHNLDAAELNFREALEANSNYGPAHNNLGQVYLARQQLYLAAWEFELAANLMPGRAEPIINQGLVYELAGRFEQAEQYYRDAYEINPQNPEAIGSLARLLVKQDDDPAEIHFLLKELVLYDSRTDWGNWAELLLATRFDLLRGATPDNNDPSTRGLNPDQPLERNQPELPPIDETEELPPPMPIQLYGPLSDCPLSNSHPSSSSEVAFPSSENQFDNTLKISEIIQAN